MKEGERGEHGVRKEGEKGEKGGSTKREGCETEPGDCKNICRRFQVAVCFLRIWVDGRGRTLLDRRAGLSLCLERGGGRGG